MSSIEQVRALVTHAISEWQQTAATLEAAKESNATATVDVAQGLEGSSMVEEQALVALAMAIGEQLSTTRHAVLQAIHDAEQIAARL